MNYRFLLGRAFRVDDVTYVVGALEKAHDGVDIAHAAVRAGGDEVTRSFPARVVVDHLVYDEEIELRPVAFA